MDKDLEIRIRNLEERLDILSDQLNKALRYIEDDPHSSLTKSRTILEQILLNVYKLEMDQDPKRFELGAILTDNQFTRKIDKRIVSRMNAIRDMCNLGVHGEKVSSKDAKIVLDNLCEVLDWYFDNYRPVKNINSNNNDNIYKQWEKSLECGLLKIKIDVNDFKTVENLSSLLFEVMLKQKFSRDDSKEASICLDELVNNVKIHVKESTIAEVTLIFEEEYNQKSLRIEVHDEGVGFDLMKVILENEKSLGRGDQEHGLLRSFRLGDYLNQEIKNGNSIIWKKDQNPRLDLNIESIFDDYEDISVVAFNNSYFVRIIDSYVSYSNFTKLLFQEHRYNSFKEMPPPKLSNSIKMILDPIRRDYSKYVGLNITGSHGTPKYEFRYSNFIFAPFVLSEILFKYINEVIPEKQLIIYSNSMSEDHAYFKNFSANKPVLYFESTKHFENFYNSRKNKSIFKKLFNNGKN